MMKCLDNYIIEKLKLNKDIKSSNIPEECLTILNNIGIENPEEEEKIEDVVTCISNWLEKRDKTNIKYTIGQSRTLQIFNIPKDKWNLYKVQNSQSYSTRFYNELGCIKDDTASIKNYTVFRTYDGYLFICKPDEVNGKGLVTPARSIRLK